MHIINTLNILHTSNEFNTIVFRVVLKNLILGEKPLLRRTYDETSCI